MADLRFKIVVLRIVVIASLRSNPGSIRCIQHFWIALFLAMTGSPVRIG